MDHQETYETKIEAVLESVKVEDQKEDNLIPLSTGVVLSYFPFPRAMLADIVRKFKEPEVPVFFNEAKQREEENPNDPEYTKKLDQYNLDLTFALLDVGITFGTKVHFIPEGFDSPYSKEWSDTCNALGLEVANTSRIRYLKWVKYIAAPTEKDIEVIADHVLSSFGVRQSTVEQALNSFPGDEVREQDSRG